MDWLLFWQILAFVGNFFGFFFLKRIPKFQYSFGTKEDEWLVDAVWGSALMFVPFMLAFSGQLSRGIKDSLFLNAFLNFICLVFPVVIEHLAEYPEFHIDVKDVIQHNSRKRIELFAAFSFASMSFGLSKAYDLTFEAGFFSLCLGYAMKVSLEVVYRNGNRNLAFILVTYSFCFMVILLRKYLEKNNGSNTTRQDNQTLGSTNRADENPNNNEGADHNLLAASNADLQGGENVTLVTLAPDQPRYHGILLPSLNGSSENLSSSQRDLRQESWDINEQNWESVPPRLYADTSTEDGEEEEEVPSLSNFVVKEGRGFIITRPEINNHFVEETHANDDRAGKIEKREVLGQGTNNEERDMRSIASSSHKKIVGGTGFGDYEKDVPLILTRSNNIVDGETQIVNDQMEGNKDQSQESDSQDYEIEDNNPLLPKSSLDKDDDNDDDDSDHESSDGEESDSDNFHSRRGCKATVGQRGRNDCLANEGKDITDLDNLQLARRSCLELSLGHCWMHKSFPPIFANQLGKNNCLTIEGEDITNSEEFQLKCEICLLIDSAQQWIQRKFFNPVSKSPTPRAKISELSDDEGSYVNDVNGRAGSKNGVGQRRMNKCTLDESRSHGILVQVTAPPVPSEISKPLEISPSSANRSFFGLPSECKTKGKLVLISETPVPAEISIPLELSYTESFIGLPSNCCTYEILVQISAMPTPIEISKPSGLSSTLENRSFFRPPSEFGILGGLFQMSAIPTPTEISKPSELPLILANKSLFRLPSECSTHGLLSRRFLRCERWDRNISVQTSVTPRLVEISKPSNDDKGDSHDEGHDGCDLNTGMGCIPGVSRRGRKKQPLKEGKRSSKFDVLRLFIKGFTSVKNHDHEKGKRKKMTKRVLAYQ